MHHGIGYMVGYLGTPLLVTSGGDHWRPVGEPPGATSDDGYCD